MKSMKNDLALFLFACLVGFSVNTFASQAVYVKTAPPKAKTATVRVKKQNHSVYIKGHWVWRNSRYVWQEGKWIKPRANHVWINGSWSKTRIGWRWIDGHWKRVK